jgi:hypothetical protein
MATVYVIYAEGDVPFVRQQVLRCLPSNGYDRWLAKHHFTGIPPVDSKPPYAETPKDAEPIEWNEETFSAALASATYRHDHARADSLVAAIVRHLEHRSPAYPPQRAYADLQNLRQEREFKLMRRYAEAVIASGTRQDRVRRLCAQPIQR